MKSFRAALFFISLFLSNLSVAQQALLCDSGGVCGPDPSSPSYGSVLSARPKKQNARGTRNPMAAVVASGASATVPRNPGSQSYNRAIPILSLPGRNGLDLNLTLHYNSRVWTLDTDSGSVSFNVDRDFPSYGFRLDFGYIENAGDVIVTESDGSKHSLLFTGGSLYDSNDGTFMEYNSSTLTLTYRNGTMVTYEPFPSESTLFRPRQIMDTNRNFITISYLAGTGNDQHIDTITDTLHRVIKFNYDANTHLLQSITQAVSASTDPSGTHTWATFNWSDTTGAVMLTYNFSGLNVVSSIASGSTIHALTGCTYPNGTGYKFSYGAWGIVNRIDLLSSTGQTRSYEAYSFPDTSVALSDVPRYTRMTVSADNVNTSFWDYSETQSAPGQVTSDSVTDPMGTTTTTNLNTDGTLKSTRITGSPNNLSVQKNYTWKQIGTTVITTVLGSVSTTDDAGNVSSVSYDYDSFGNVTDLKEFDFGGGLLRETVSSYKGTPFTDQHILNLPQSIQIKDGSGAIEARTDFDYDTLSLTPITGLQQNDGNTTLHRGNLTSVTRYTQPATPSGGVNRTFTYDVAGNMVVAQLDCCNQKTFTFDSTTQYAYLNSIVRGPTSGPHFTTNFIFNPDNGRILSSTDANNQPRSYEYDNMFRVTSVTTPPSNGQTVKQTITYADDILTPQVTTTTTANSTKMLQSFDGLGHLLRQDTIDSSTAATVSTTQFHYDPIWRRDKTSNPYAGSEPLAWNIVTYDALNRVTSSTPPSGGGTSFNFAGKTVLITDPAGKQRKNYFDALGRLVQVDEPGWGDALTATDTVTISGGERSKWVSTRYCAQFDLRGRCVDWEVDSSLEYDDGTVSITVNGGTPYSYTYGQNDSSSTVALALAGKINADPARAVNASVSGSVITLSAPAAGPAYNSITVSSSSLTNAPTLFGTGSTSFPATTATATLTGGENAVTQDNAVLSSSRHVTTTYGYDVFDHLTSVSHGAIGPISGQQLSGQPRSYAYDALGRLTTSSTPESGTVTNYYTDASGGACSGDPSLVCRIVDARGVTRNLSYDGVNRLFGVTYTNDPANAAPVTYQYDFGGQAAFANDRVTKIIEGANSQTFTYDDRGRITSAAYAIDGTNYPVQYAYNAADELTSLTYPSGRVVQPDYDNVGRLNHIADANAPANPYLTINSADYSGANLVKQLTLGNGVVGQFNYNDHLQISALRYYNPAAPSGTSDVLNLSYDYGTGNNGQIQAMHYFTAPNSEDLTKSESFTYDPWSRLRQAQTLDQVATGTWNLQWGYDRLGNRLSQGGTGNGVTIGQPNFTIDPATNRITNSGYQYDNAGNMTHDATTAYTYDGANRLVTVNTGTATAAYSYFGSLRIKKVAGGTTTVYIYSGSKPIAEYVGGQLSKEYVYRGSQLLATVAGTAVTYHHPDHLSNRAETDSSGNVTRRFGHFPYGETWYETPGSDKWKFAGYERDVESGLDYANFRYYSSTAARFMSPDPFGGGKAVPQSLNRYAYVGNDPVNIVDRLGLTWVSFEQTFCVDSGSGDVCETETDWVWLEDGGGGPLGGGDIGGGGGGGGGGGAGSNPHQDLRAQALRALLTNPKCRGLFGGLQNALNALFGSQFIDYSPGMSNPDSSNIPAQNWQGITSYLSTGQVVAPNTDLHPAISAYWGGQANPHGDIFLSPVFFNSVIPTGFSQAGEDTQMTIVLHELEHISTQSNTPDTNPQDHSTINQNCTPNDVPTENAPTSTDLGGGSTP